MVGGIIIAFILVIVAPVAVMMSLSVLAGLLGWSLQKEGVAANEGSELIDLNY